jgi:hypothetical protein
MSNQDQAMIDRAARCTATIVGRIAGAVHHITGLSLDSDARRSLEAMAMAEILAALGEQEADTARRLRQDTVVIPHHGVVE